MKRILILIICCCTICYGQSKDTSQKETRPEDKEWLAIPFFSNRLFSLNLRMFTILPNEKAIIWVKDFPRKDAVKSEQAKMLKIRKERKLSTQGYGKYYSTMTQYEVDCKKRSLHLLQIIDYDEDGEVLDSTDTKDLSEWTDVAPETLGDAIEIMACLERGIKYSKELRDAKKKPSN